MSSLILNSLYSHPKTSALFRKEKRIKTNQSITLASKQLQIRKFTLFIAHPPTKQHDFPSHNPPIRNPPTPEYQCRPISIRKVSPQPRIGVSVSFLAFKFTASPLVYIRSYTAESRGWIFLTQFLWRTWPCRYRRELHTCCFVHRASTLSCADDARKLCRALAMHVGRLRVPS